MKKSKFDLSHTLLSTGDFGYLYPILCEDILPGDTFKCSSEVFVKAIPLLAPVLAQADVRVDYFFVPNRILWEEWSDFITGGKEGTFDQKEPWFLYGSSSVQANINSEQRRFCSALYQLPISADGEPSGAVRLSILPALAYERIYRDWYMDQNVESDVWYYSDNVDRPFKYGFLPKNTQGDSFYDINGDFFNGTNVGYDFISKHLHFRQRHYRKDMFTSALPWPQRGPEVGFTIPNDDKNYDVYGETVDEGDYYRTDGSVAAGTPTFQNGKLLVGSNSAPAQHSHNVDSSVQILEGDLANISIRELRRLSALQKWFERNARWGSRYIEQILSHFGVHTPDYRLQRAEYLGGTISPINISETYQTADSSSEQETENVLGQYAGHMSSYGVNGMRKYTAQEHGWFLGLLSIVPKPSYSQGVQRRFTRQTRLDYAWPEFASIGEQAIARKELYFAGLNENSSAGFNTLNGAFGYTTRYAEYKSRQDRFDNNFRINFPFWHLGRIFDSMPVLSRDFLEARNSSSGSQYDRIFAYTPNEGQYEQIFHFLFQIRHHLKMRRPLPKYVNPSLS